MAKKSKVEKRLSKPEKVTNEELNKIQTLIDGVNRSKMNLGTMEIEKHRTLHMIAGMEGEIKLFRDSLAKSYGTDDINLDTGVINYKKDEQANKKD